MINNQNNGHGWVFPRPDGLKARCGGPGLCKECAADQVRYRATFDEMPPALQKSIKPTIEDHLSNISNQLDQLIILMRERK